MSVMKNRPNPRFRGLHLLVAFTLTLLLAAMLPAAALAQGNSGGKKGGGGGGDDGGGDANLPQYEFLEITTGPFETGNKTFGGAGTWVEDMNDFQVVVGTLRR